MLIVLSNLQWFWCVCFFLVLSKSVTAACPQQFNAGARRLRRAHCRKHLKMIAIVVCVVASSFCFHLTLPRLWILRPICLYVEVVSLVCQQCFKLGICKDMFVSFQDFYPHFYPPRWLILCPLPVILSMPVLGVSPPPGLFWLFFCTVPRIRSHAPDEREHRAASDPSHHRLGVLHLQPQLLSLQLILAGLTWTFEPRPIRCSGPAL